jgi:hypothetical protein
MNCRILSLNLSARPNRRPTDYSLGNARETVQVEMAFVRSLQSNSLV